MPLPTFFAWLAKRHQRRKQLDALLAELQEWREERATRLEKLRKHLETYRTSTSPLGVTESEALRETA